MKSFTFVLLALVTAASLGSCKKDKDHAKGPVTIEGSWSGTYSMGSGPADKAFHFVLKAGGVFEEYNPSNQKIAEGVWEIDNDILTAGYKNLPPSTVAYSLIASFDKNAAKLTGTWGYDASSYDGGYMYLYKD